MWIVHCAVLCIVQVKLYKTGGGPPIQSSVTDVDMRVVEAFSSQFFPMTNHFDDDAAHHAMDFQPVLLANGVRIYHQ